MSLNLELKAKIADLEAADRIGRSLPAQERFVIDQTDSYFFAATGRLKLRQSPQLGDELIYYLRPDRPGSKSCRYWRRPIVDARALLIALDFACGLETRVIKTRIVYLIDNVRVHLDKVRDLGSFLEFEVVLHNSIHRAAAPEQLNRLSQLFGIHAANRVAGSYRELMLEVSSKE